MHDRGSVQDLPDVGVGPEHIAARWNELDRRVRTMVDERPLTSVVVAVVAGYLFARLTSRL